MTDNVTEAGMLAYLQMFFATLEKEATEHLPPEVAKQMLHLALLPGEVVGYVSTRSGAAWEVRPAPTTSFRVVRGSRRAEDLLYDVPRWAIANPPGLVVRDRHFITLDGGIFQIDGPMLRVLGNTDDVHLDNQQVNWPDGHRKHVTHAEVSSDRSAERWSPAYARELALRYVMHAMVSVAQAAQALQTPHPVVDLVRAGLRMKEKGVALFGHYDMAGQDRLDELGEVLRARGYDVVVIKDVPDIAQQSLAQKVTSIGGYVRFVVFEDTDPSGHLTELEIAREQRWVTVVM
jgi:hypothetical protein